MPKNGHGNRAESSGTYSGPKLRHSERGGSNSADFITWKKCLQEIGIALHGLAFQFTKQKDGKFGVFDKPRFGYSVRCALV